MKVFHPFRLDTVNHCVWRAEERIRLTPKAFDVLRYLVEHPDRLVTQNEILESLWPETYVNPEAVRKHVLEIRKVLGDRVDRPSFIQTLPKRGYQFVARVTDEQPLRPSAAIEAARYPVVGRDAALARLQDHFEKAWNGQRQVLFITGEAGIGKTTLADVFQEQAARYPNLRLARGQCIEGFGGKEAYYPMLEALGSLARAPDDGSVVRTLAKYAPTWLAQFPSLVTAEQRDSLEREILGSTRERMVREICEALEVMAAESPLIAILEDLHWADASTLDLISALARRRESAKLLLIGTYRPVDVVVSGQLKALKQDLVVHQLCQEIAVERLGAADVAEYLAKEFGANSFPSGLADLIHHHSGGNPLFMSAIVQDMMKRGLIAQGPERWTLAASLEDIYPGIPETLQQMLEIQFEQLSAEEQRILEACSVAGDRFPVWAAAAMLETSPAAIEETCEKLARDGRFIRFMGVHEAVNGADSAHYEFRHSLYRQALDRRLSSASRARLHRSLGIWLMGALSGGKRELASELALHFEEGLDFEQATRCLMLSAENAARRFAHGDCIRVLQHALDLVPLLAPGARSEVESQILQRMGDAYYALGAMSDSAQAYEAAAERAAEAGLRQAQIAALSRLAVPAWYLDPARGNKICEQAIEVSRQHADPLLLARTQLAAACFRLIYDDWSRKDEDACASARQTIRRLSVSSIPEDVLYAYVQTIQGHYAEALQQAEAGMTAAAASPAAYLLAVGVKTLILIGMGRLGELLQIVRTGRELARKNGEDPWVFIFREAWLRAICFDFEGVRRLSEIMMRSDAEQHAAEPRAMAMIAAGYVELYGGRSEEALEYFAKVRDPAITPRFLFHWRWRMRAQLGSIEARMQTGDLENARREADDLLESAFSIAEPNLHAFAWEARARVAVADQDRARALACVENALVILNQFDIPAVAWRVHATAWDSYSYAGETERAETHRERARHLVMRLADSFESDEPLRSSLLGAAPVRRIFGQAAASV